MLPFFLTFFSFPVLREREELKLKKRPVLLEQLKATEGTRRGCLEKNIAVGAVATCA